MVTDDRKTLRFGGNVTAIKRLRHRRPGARADSLLRRAKPPTKPRGSGGIGGASSDPPLFYALETIPCGLAASDTLLDHLELMRLFSALMAGLTTLFVFLFLRETLPSAPWA
jgi:hypothetical protein